MRRGLGGYFEVLSARRRYRIPLARILHPGRLAELGVRFGQKLTRLEGGPAHLERLEEGHRLGVELSGRPAGATWALLGVIAAAFLLQVILSGGWEANSFTQARVNIRLGASANALNGREPWRLLTATFLHGSLLHVYMNGMALFALGSVLERLFGAARFVTVFLVSAAFGAALSSWHSEAAFAVGASGGIFGALGALAALHLIGGERLPPRFRQSLRWWVSVIALSVALPILLPIIDAWGHFGGAAAGLGLGSALALDPRFRLGGPPGRIVQTGTAVALSAYGLAGLFALTSAIRPEASHRKDLEEVLLRPRGGSSTVGIAARILSSPDAPAHLRQAADAWLSSAAAKPDAPPELLLLESERMETRGSLPGAVALRWQALVAHQAGAFPALAEGLWKLDDRPLALTSASSVELRRLLGDDRLDMVVDPPVSRALSIFFLQLGPKGELRGVFEWPLRPAGEPISRASTRVSQELRASLEAGDRLEVALWAEPPLADRASLHVVDPSALRTWRAFAPPQPSSR